MTNPDCDWNWEYHVQFFHPTGSRYICDPAPTDTDEDWVCYVKDLDTAAAELEALGFVTEGLPGFYTGNNNGKFLSMRRDELNLILTPEKEFYDLFVAGTVLAQRLNILNKGDRIALFQIILYGVHADNLEQPYENDHLPL